MNVSYFKPNQLSKPYNIVSIEKVFSMISSGKLNEITEKVRNETDKKKRNNLKLNLLPSITVSGVFTERKKTGIKEHSGLLQIDFDNLTNIIEVKEQLCADNFIYACWVSPSGNGLKAIVKINPEIESHALVFLQIESYFKKKYNLQIDKSCKDVCRLMFLSNDSSIYINKESYRYTDFIGKANIKSTKDEIKQPFINDVQADVLKCIEQIENHRIDITDVYNDWISIGFAFADEFGISGNDYFHRVSKISSKYTPENCENQYNECIKARKGIGIKPFFKLCKDFGIDISPVRNGTENQTKKQTERPKKEKIEKPQNEPENELSKPLETDSENVDTDLEKYEFFKQEGCFYARYTFRKTTIDKRLSNFIFESLYHLDDGTMDTKRLFKIQKDSGEIYLIEVLSSQMKMDSFKTILRSKGGCVYSGDGNHLDKIFEYVFSRETQAFAINSLGFQHEHNIYSFADLIITEKNEILKINSLGIVKDTGKNFYLPAFAPTNINDKRFMNERLFAYKGGNLEIEKFFELIYNAFNINGAIALMYVINCLFRDLIFNHLRFFPFLFLFGDAGTGKTSFVDVFLSLFGEPLKGITFNDSIKGLLRTLSQRINSLFYVKEYRNDIDSEMIDVFKNGYDGAGYTRANTSNDNKTNSTNIESGIMIDGNELPTAKAAVFTRMILLDFQKSIFTQQQTDSLNTLRNEAKNGFCQITKELLKHRELFRNEFKSTYDKILNLIKDGHFDTIENKYSKLQARNLNHVTFILTPFILLSEIYKFPFTDTDLTEQVLNYAIDQDSLLNEVKDISIFWQSVHFERMKPEHQRKINHGENYYIDSIDKILYIKINEIFPFYVEYCRINKIKNIDKSSMIKLLTSESNTSYIKFNQKGRSAAGNHKKIGSCYKFRFESVPNTDMDNNRILINNIEVSL